jgi:hypothetical protein
MDDGFSFGRSYARPVFVLIHSPLLGPASWMPAAEDFYRRGYCALVPSLRGLADAAGPQWRYAISAVRAATVGVDSPLMLVAHGDACRLLPAVARNLTGEVLGLMFVDGCLPPEAGSSRLASEPFLERVRSLIRDGADPRASWFHHEIPVPTACEHRAVRALLHDRTRLPLAYFSDRVPMPEGWNRDRCAYVCLSEQAGADSAAQARSYGWPVVTIPGAHHLSIVTDAEAVTAVLLDLAGELTAAPPRSRIRPSGTRRHRAQTPLQSGRLGGATRKASPPQAA